MLFCSGGVKDDMSLNDKSGKFFDLGTKLMLSYSPGVRDNPPFWNRNILSSWNQLFLNKRKKNYSVLEESWSLKKRRFNAELNSL